MVPVHVESGDVDHRVGVDIGDEGNEGLRGISFFIRGASIPNNSSDGGLNHEGSPSVAGGRPAADFGAMLGINKSPL